MEYVVIMDTPCLTLISELWGAHCGPWSGLVLPGCTAVIGVFTCDGVCSYSGHPIAHAYVWAMGCPLWEHSWKIDSLTTAPCWYASWSGLVLSGCAAVIGVLTCDGVCGYSGHPIAHAYVWAMGCPLWEHSWKIDSLTTAPCWYASWSGLVLSGCAAVIGVLTCDGVCSYSGHPMAHAYVWAMGCPLWEHSWKIDILITAPCWYASWSGLVLSGCAAVIGVFTCDGVCSYSGHPMPHPYVWAMGCPFWGFSWKNDSVTTAPCFYASWNVLVLSGCAAVIGVFTCDGVRSYNGHPMPHACVWAMGCPFWGLSVKLTAIQQHHVVMGLSHLAALVTQVFTWDGVHTYNGHPMPHSYGCAMGCSFRGL